MSQISLLAVSPSVAELFGSDHGDRTGIIPEVFLFSMRNLTRRGGAVMDLIVFVLDRAIGRLPSLSRDGGSLAINPITSGRRGQ